MPFIQLQLRNGTSTEWQLANPILALGEMGIEIDTNKFKIGKGGDWRWRELPYGGLVGPQGTTGPQGATGPGATGPEGPMAPAMQFDGGYPSRNGIAGAVFDCGFYS